jgi:UDP-3-O-[3-hydroxymyristoyl] N-acetylglucosamine deacetylase
MFITNAVVEIQGGELPIGDGSAAHFYEAISKVGVEEQSAGMVGLCISKRRYIQEGESSIQIEPAEDLVIDCTLDWHPNIKGRLIYRHTPEAYRSIVTARTFAEKKYLKKIQRAGRARGAVLGVNTIDIDANGPSDEYVRHKILDILGDLSLLYGFYVRGKITAINSGHKLHHRLVKEVLDVKPTVRDS